MRYLRVLLNDRRYMNLVSVISIKPSTAPFTGFSFLHPNYLNIALALIGGFFNTPIYDCWSDLYALIL